jgi:hypothetical protein
VTEARVTEPRPIEVPRTAERLLEALGAEPEFRDALLGDLHEEFAIRAAWDGDRAARRWYRREALRVAPHLLRDGVRWMRGADLARLAGAVLTSFALIAMLGALLGALIGPERVVGALVALQIPPEAPWWRTLLAFAAALTFRLTLTATGAMLGGYVAARLDARSPLLASAAVGVVRAALPLVTLVMVLGAAAAVRHLWLWPVHAAVALGASVLGGALRVSRRRPALGG